MLSSASNLLCFFCGGGRCEIGGGKFGKEEGGKREEERGERGKNRNLDKTSPEFLVFF